MKEYKIYLSGGMQKFGKENFDKGNDWRKYCKKVLETCECDYKVKACNPNDLFNFRDEPQYTSQREVMNLDIHKLRQSNLVIVNFNDKWSLGTMSEIAIAYDRCIDEMLDYIQDFYLR